MTQTPDFLDPDVWLYNVFSAQAVNKGGIIRRRVRDVDRIVGLDAFYGELRRRGFHAVENAGHIVIFCNQDPIRRVC